MRHIPKLNTFFVEIIIVILFFAIAVAVTLQLFAAANSRAKQSMELNAAVIKAQNAAESLNAVEDRSSLSVFLPDSSKTKDQSGNMQYVIQYDKDWKENSKSPCYVLTVTLRQVDQKNGTDLQAEIVVNRSAEGTAEKKKIYRLAASRYIPGRVQE